MASQPVFNSTSKKEAFASAIPKSTSFGLREVGVSTLQPLPHRKS